MMYERIFREFQKRKIQYLVIGGIAVNLHGFSRATGDLDILLSFEERNMRKFIDMVKSLGMKPRLPVALEAFANSEKRSHWIHEKGMKVFSVYNPQYPIEHIDVMVENYIDFVTAYKKRKVLSAGSIEISVLGISDLIKLKKIAGRERDKIDIKALKQIMEIQNEKKTKKS